MPWTCHVAHFSPPPCAQGRYVDFSFREQLLILVSSHSLIASSFTVGRGRYYIIPFSFFQLYFASVLPDSSFMPFLLQNPFARSFARRHLCMLFIHYLRISQSYFGPARRNAFFLFPHALRFLSPFSCPSCFSLEVNLLIRRQPTYCNLRSIVFFVIRADLQTNSDSDGGHSSPSLFLFPQPPPFLSKRVPVFFPFPRNYCVVFTF